MQIFGMILIVVGTIIVLVGLQGLSVVLIQPLYKKFVKAPAHIIKQYASDDPEYMRMTLENIRKNNPELYKRVKDEYKNYSLKRTYSPVLEYKVGKKDYRLVANTNSKHKLDEKKAYFVRYNPQNPLEAYMCYYHKQIFILVIGAIVLIAGLAFYLFL